MFRVLLSIDFTLRGWWRALRCSWPWAALLLALIVGTAMSAAPLDTLTVVMSEDSATYRNVVETLRRELERAAPGRFRVGVIDAKTVKTMAAELLKNDAGLIVTVGVAAATAVTESGDVRAPVLHTLVPRIAFDKLQASRRSTGETASVSAIYLDQPASRTMEFVHLALPKASRIGMIFGPDSAVLAKPNELAARQIGLRVESETITSAEEIPRVLDRVLSRSDLLLAVPDPQVYTRSTLQGILLSAYRANSPVIGFSSAYVRAGALAAVYSTPEQIGRQAADVILRAAAQTRWQLPPPQEPKYFSVEVNRNVARSLGLVLQDDTQLLERLKLSGGSEL